MWCRWFYVELLFAKIKIQKLWMKQKTNKIINNETEIKKTGSETRKHSKLDPHE